MNHYKAISKQIFSSGNLSIVPIRNKDRYDIMRWRNEQIYHLRQDKLLTKEDQDHYFNKIVSKLFDQKNPNQILFSYLQGQECIGYGGLVHINWIDKNAEISFIMNTELENKYFDFHWSSFLNLLEQVAFEELGFHKLYVYAFNLRPHLYKALESNKYFQDAVLDEHCFYKGQYIDVIIHAKLNSK